MVDPNDLDYIAKADCDSPATNASASIVQSGFRFDGASQALANPNDSHDLKVFDPSIRGRTDQFIYRFIKLDSARASTSEEATNP